MMRTAYVVTIAAGALAGGFAAGYLVASRRLESELSSRLEEETEKTKEFYKRLYKVDAYSSPETVVYLQGLESVDTDSYVTKSLLKGMTEESEEKAEAKAIVQQILEDEEYKQNIFEQPGLDSPEEEDQPKRNPERPYVISEGEWTLQEGGSIERLQLTYYEGDNTLTDDQDSIIADIDEVIGEENLNEFGKQHASDPNVLFVRNEKLDVEFEIVRDPGTYSERVLGIPDEDLHPVKTPRKRRDERDD